MGTTTFAWLLRVDFTGRGNSLKLRGYMGSLTWFFSAQHLLDKGLCGKNKLKKIAFGGFICNYRKTVNQETHLSSGKRPFKLMKVRQWNRSPANIKWHTNSPCLKIISNSKSLLHLPLLESKHELRNESHLHHDESQVCK